MDHLCSDGFGWGSLTAGGSTFVAGVLMLALTGTQKGLLGGFSISLLMGLFTGYVGCVLRASVPRQQGTIAWPSLDLVLGTTRYHSCHTVWVKAVTVVTKVPGQ